MKHTVNIRTAPAVTILLATLICWVSLAGILSDGFYARETLNWQLQSLGQDQFDLYVLIPVLLLTGINTPQDRHGTSLPWAGTLLYIIYTFTIYCFAVHFNRLFPVYCIILGLAIYSFALFIYQEIKNKANWNGAVNRLAKIIAIYFIILSVLFYGLWLSDIIGAISRSALPATVVEAGLPTNPVQVIDLSVFLPATFITGVLLFRRHVLAPDLAAMLLFFFVLMDSTIAWLAIKMNQPGSGSLFVVIGMIALGLLSATLLLLLLRKMNEKHVVNPRPAHKPVR